MILHNNYAPIPEALPEGGQVANKLHYKYEKFCKFNS